MEKKTGKYFYYPGTVFDQRSIIRSLHTNCTRIFLFSEMWYLREFLNFLRKHADIRITP